MWEVIGQSIYIMGIAASKASVALFLLRIVILKWHKALLWRCMLLTALLCVVTTVLLYMQCRPVAFLWDHTIQGGDCWLTFAPVGLAMGGMSSIFKPVLILKITNTSFLAWSAAMDFVLALLPWLAIMNLEMKRRKRLIVTFYLSLGMLCVSVPKPATSTLPILIHSPFQGLY
jgi:hypothetical protein